MKTILHIVGNRPQFIKLAILHNELSKDTSFLQKIIHTGQHFSYDMSEIFFSQLHIPEPAINFNLQQYSSNLFIGQAAETLQNYFSTNIDNSIVLVYGDTNTTLAAAIAAKKSRLPLVHIEAGVRTMDTNMPEEINRLITDRLSDINYCCTTKNFETMEAEGYGRIIPSQLQLTGDLMLDAFLTICPSTQKIVEEKEYIACTIHREANLSNKHRLKAIIDALNKINRDMQVIMTVHPHTKKRMQEYGIEPSFSMLAPLGYLEMKNFLSHANYIITDSGGISREAYFLEKKSLIVMDNPFWPEIVEANCAIPVPANIQAITSSFEQLPFLQPGFKTQIFGNGNAAKNIHQHLSANINSL